MKKSEKTVLQGMLQDILYAHESGGFQEAWSRAQESLFQMEEDPDGRRVFDIEWSSEDDDLPSEAYVPEDIALMDLKRYLEKNMMKRSVLSGSRRTPAVLSSRRRQALWKSGPTGIPVMSAPFFFIQGQDPGNRGS